MAILKQTSFIADPNLELDSDILDAAAATLQEGKTEGTNTTYGQDVVFEQTFDGEIRNDINYSLPEGHESPLSVFTSPPPDEPETDQVLNPYEGFQVPGGIVPEDTVVTVQQQAEDLSLDEFGTISSLTCKVRTNIAIAAASANDSTATVAVKNLSAPTQQSVINNIFSSFLDQSVSVTTTAIVKGSAILPKAEIKKVLSEAQKVDLNVTLKSRRSESLPFNTLKTPILRAKYNYNFFSEFEEDTDIQENRSRDPLRTNKPYHVPRYVQLKWGIAKVTNQIFGASVDRDDIFTRSAGASTGGGGRGTITDSSNGGGRGTITAETSSTGGGGRGTTTIDIHSPEDGFDSIANQQLYPNSINTTMISGGGGRITQIPYEETGTSR